LQECRAAWSARLRRDTADLTTAGDLLRQTAGRYDGTDELTAARLAKVERELPL